MSANKAKNTVPELLLRKALYHSGLRGYRLHRRISLGPSSRHLSLVPRPSFVRPDISYVSKKLAIFVHGCFWHHCPKCSPHLPKHNTDFWRSKFEKNVARDETKRIALESLGWTVITVWECDLKTNLDETLQTIREAHANLIH